MIRQDPSTARGTVRRGSRASSASGAAASNPMKASMTKTEPATSPDAPVKPLTVANFSVNTLSVSPPTALHEHPDRQRDEHDDLESAEHARRTGCRA